MGVSSSSGCIEFEAEADPVVPGEVLLRPVYAAAVLLLALNDHVLKAELHDAITGKLSDFAGLCFFPAFLVALGEVLASVFGSRWRGSSRALWGSSLAAGATFTLIKAVPEAVPLYAVGLGALQWPYRLLQALISGTDLPALLPVAVTPDRTDLLALPALLVGPLLGPARRPRPRPTHTKVGVAVSVTLGLIFPAGVARASEVESPRPAPWRNHIELNAGGGLGALTGRARGTIVGQRAAESFAYSISQTGAVGQLDVSVGARRRSLLLALDFSLQRFIPDARSQERVRDLGFVGPAHALAGCGSVVAEGAVLALRVGGGAGLCVLDTSPGLTSGAARPVVFGTVGPSWQIGRGWSLGPRLRGFVLPGPEGPSYGGALLLSVAHDSAPDTP